MPLPYLVNGDLGAKPWWTSTVTGKCSRTGGICASLYVPRKALLHDCTRDSDGTINIDATHYFWDSSLRQRCKRNILQGSIVDYHLCIQVRRLVSTSPTILLKAKGPSMGGNPLLSTT